MTPRSPERIEGLSRIARSVDAVICDLWGVVHDGVSVFDGAIDCLTRLRANQVPVILLSNAPRPHDAVIKQIEGLGVPPACYDHVITSGDLARSYATNHFRGQSFFHLGPPRDHSTIAGLDLVQTKDPASAAVIICTGLMDDHESDVEWHRPLLERLAAHKIPMLCANPDRVVEIGRRRVACAGMLAERYEAMGRTVVWLGKPHDAPYRACLDWFNRRRPVSPGKVLAIGDSLMTDMVGALEQGFQSLFISGGIHREELSEAERRRMPVEAFLMQKGLAVNYVDRQLRWSGRSGT